MLAFLVLGIYLLAAAISTEDLLLGHTTKLTQLGVEVPPQVSFGMAPLGICALHGVFTLIRYDLLAVNLQALRVELETTAHSVSIGVEF